MANLVDAVMRAKSGYRTDVRALGESLGFHELVVPLGGNSLVQLGAISPSAIRTFGASDGNVWIPVFTHSALLRREAVRKRWASREREAKFVACNGRTALESMSRELLEAGAATGVVFDLGYRSELMMTAIEVQDMIRGEARPLVGYASRQPARGNEQMMIGKPGTSPPDDLLRAIASTLASEPVVSNYILMQVFIPERDVTPHLLLDIRASGSEQDRRRISQRVGAAMGELALPPPGYVDVVFNFGEG